MGDKHQPKDEAGPEDAVRRQRMAPDDPDVVEGHGIRLRTIPERDEVGPDGLRGRSATDEDDETPGPNDVRLSDRTRKVDIVPVTWD